MWVATSFQGKDWDSSSGGDGLLVVSLPLVSSWSSRPSLGRATVWCLDSVTRITLPNTFWPFKWLIAAGGGNTDMNRVLKQTVLQCCKGQSHACISLAHGHWGADLQRCITKGCWTACTVIIEHLLSETPIATHSLNAALKHWRDSVCCFATVWWSQPWLHRLRRSAWLLIMAYNDVCVHYSACKPLINQSFNEVLTDHWHCVRFKGTARLFSTHDCDCFPRVMSRSMQALCFLITSWPLTVGIWI